MTKEKKKFADLLASTEMEIKQLCQEENVHLLAKGTSGELLWLQTEGNLKQYVNMLMSINPTLRQAVAASKAPQSRTNCWQSRNW